MNAYFEAVFGPVREHGGIVSDVKGDSMLAVWFALNPDATLRHQACLAALEIARAVRWFNQGVSVQIKESFEGLQLPTRIGMDAGVISLGTVGGGDHYEYRPVGAPVTTADRIEGLNKDLGTQILLSEEALFQLEGFLTRELGEFLLRGKKRPVVVHELICRRERSNEAQQRLCEVFREGMNAYRRRCWDEAIDMFAKASDIRGQDGPSLFYSRLCDAYRKNPPGEEWDGLIQMDKK
jgi:adenylate cyclase